MRIFGGSGTVSDWVAQIAKVISSSLAAPDDGGPNRPVQVSIEGVGAVDVANGTISTADGAGEANEEADLFSALGIVGRPLPPTVAAAQSEHAEVVCLRLADGLLPIAIRDVRLRMGGNAPNEGTTAFVGYGGAYHSISPVNNDDLTQGAIQVIYVPYDFDADGAAQKAHSITVDPTSGNESISIVHAEGMAITMAKSATDKNPLVLKNKAGDATLRLDDDGVTITAKTITLSGGVVVGEPALAQPLLAGVASQGSTKFFLSP